MGEVIQMFDTSGMTNAELAVQYARAEFNAEQCIQAMSAVVALVETRDKVKPQRHLFSISSLLKPDRFDVFPDDLA